MVKQVMVLPDVQTRSEVETGSAFVDHGTHVIDGDRIVIQSPTFVNELKEREIRVMTRRQPVAVGLIESGSFEFYVMNLKHDGGRYMLVNDETSPVYVFRNQAELHVWSFRNRLGDLCFILHA